jgi:hypothetical protein
MPTALAGDYAFDKTFQAKPALGVTASKSDGTRVLGVPPENAPVFWVERRGSYQFRDTTGRRLNTSLVGQRKKNSHATEPVQ